jgi:hypothetical protein
MSQPASRELRDRLRYLYGRQSKHSAYQSIPGFISEILGYQEDIRKDWRDDRNRYDFILSQISPKPNEEWVDFGANTGFFTYSLAHQFPETNFLAIEANPDHASFLDEVRQAFGIKNVRISSDSIGLDDLDKLSQADVMLHLNVLHHAGADFDAHHVTDRTSFLDYAIRYLTGLKMATRILVLQVGLNLWGNKGLPIFPITDSLGTLKSLISLIRSSGWEVRSMAYPAIQPSGEVSYIGLPKAVLCELEKREQDCDWACIDRAISEFGLAAHVGEFYHRPLLVLGHVT